MSQNGADPGTWKAFPDSLSKEAAANTTKLANGHSVDDKVSSSRQADSSSSQEAGVSDRKATEGRANNRGDNYTGRTSIVGDVLQSIAAGDDEGRSRQRILAFAAKRYANAVDKNPQDADALYNWALVLQETADSLGNENASSEKDTLLDEACKKYEAATRFCPTLHEAFYNWGIAVSDRAKLRGRTKEAEELWKQACQRYERSVQLNWTSPQALNNWGLALQELGAIVPLKEKRGIVKTAIRKFRAAIRLRFDFHRAVYNLGTVLYGLAEDTIRSGRKASTSEGNASDLYSASAVYIAAAHSLKPDYPVYRSALRLVRSMLPLPYLKVGYLTVPPNGNALAPHADWQKRWFVLDHDAFYQTEKAEGRPLQKPSSGTPETSNKSTPSPQKPGSGTPEKSSSSPRKPSGTKNADDLRVEVHDILGVAPTADLSLPAGGGLVIDTPSGQHYLIAESWDAVDGWVDAIRLVYTIFVRGKTDALASVLTT